MNKTLEQRVEQLEKRVAELSETRVVTVHLKADEFITALDRMIKEIMAAINEVNEKKAAELEKVVRPKGSKRLGGSEKAFIKASEAVKAEAYCKEKQVSANTMRESSVNLDETMASMANLARKELSRLLE